MEEYIPKEMDINKTYSVKLDKKDKRISIYDEIEDDDRFYVYDLPAELLNTISEEVEEPIYSYKSSYSYTPSYSYRNNQNRRGGMMLC